MRSWDGVAATRLHLLCPPTQRNADERSLELLTRRRLEATTGAGEVAEGASGGVAARLEAAWVLAVLRLVSFGVGRCGLKAARLDDRADAAAGRGARPCWQQTPLTHRQ